MVSIMNKQQKQIRQDILDHTTLQWVRKDIFKLPNEASFPDGFFQIKTELEKIGYKLNITTFHKQKNTLYFLYENDRNGIEIQMKFLNTFHFINEFYNLIKTHFQFPSGMYFGTNEWFYDLCKNNKIPFRNRLASLNVYKGQYWFCNELCKSGE